MSGQSEAKNNLKVSVTVTYSKNSHKGMESYSTETVTQLVYAD